jgi:hypothetical protein
MNNERSQWWWLPSALFFLTGILFMVLAAVPGNAMIWVPLGIVMMIVAVTNFRRRRIAGIVPPHK